MRNIWGPHHPITTSKGKGKWLWAAWSKSLLMDVAIPSHFLHHIKDIIWPHHILHGHFILQCPNIVYGHNIQNKLYGHTISRCCKLYGQAIYQRFYMATTYDMIYTVTLYQTFYMSTTYNMIYMVTLYQRFYMATTSGASLVLFWPALAPAAAPALGTFISPAPAPALAPAPFHIKIG